MENKKLHYFRQRVSELKNKKFKIIVDKRFKVEYNVFILWNETKKENSYGKVKFN